MEATKEELISAIDQCLIKLGEQCDACGLRKALLTIEIAQILGDMKRKLEKET